LKNEGIQSLKNVNSIMVERCVIFIENY